MAAHGDGPSYSHRNRLPSGGRASANGRFANLGTFQQKHGDMEMQIHHIEKEAYTSVLRAFKAQSDAITWEKESLITELRKELRVSDEEHRELLPGFNADDRIERIRFDKQWTLFFWENLFSIFNWILILSSYKIQLNVYDNSGTATFTMFDRDAQTLLNTSASDFVESMPPDSIEPPGILRNIVDITLIFEIKVTSYNMNQPWSS